MSASSIMVIWKKSIRQRLMWTSTSSPITIMTWHTMVKWEEGLRFMADAYAKVSSVRDGIEAERNLAGILYGLSESE